MKPMLYPTIGPFTSLCSTLFSIGLLQYDGLHHVTPYKPLSAAMRGHGAKIYKNSGILDP